MPGQLLGKERERQTERKKKIRKRVEEERERQRRRREKDVIVSRSNLLSVYWLNKSASLYFPGTLNNSHTYREKHILCLNSAVNTDWQKICSSCRSKRRKKKKKERKVSSRVWPGSGGVER